MEEMEHRGNGIYAAPVVLGEGRYEMFRLCLNMDKTMEIYPLIKDASEKIWVEGPDAKSAGRYWIIDGRDQEVPAGTLYEISFRWSSEVKRISWKQIGPALDSAGYAWPAYEHKYSLTGSFLAGRFADMKQTATSTWEGSFRLGVLGEEEFQLARDSDPNQRIYPATAGAVRTTVPVRGPDSLGEGKCWIIRGLPNELITVRLEVADGHFRVAVESEVRGEKVWESEAGWDRRQYCVLGSWSGWVPVAMVMDPAEPGIFRAYGKVGKTFSHRHGAYVERFQIVVDGDSNVALYPELGEADAMQYIVEGPDRHGSGLHWLIRSPRPNVRFEVCLDLNAEDRRRRVYWSWSDPSAIARSE